MTPPTSQQLPAHVLMNRMINGASVSQAIFVAAEFGVADLLKNEALTSAAIASRVGANADALHRILRALASIGIFRQDESGRFEGTALSDYLQSDTPGSMRASARMRGAKWYWDMLGAMLNCARTGEKWGMDFGYFEEHKHDADVYNQAMTSATASEAGSILESYDFTGTNRLMDIGGGYGNLLAEVLAANPHMRGVLFDAPSVIEKAGLHMEATTVAHRCELIGGDFLMSVPFGADTVMMKHVIHDWNDENSLRILKSCHAALSASGKLLIIESIIRPGNDPSPGKMLDLVMLLVGGRERTEAEFQVLLDHAGFDLTRIVATSSPVSVVEARKR